MYVLERTDQGGGYVARPGSKHSYVKALQHARVYATRAEAEDERCPGNEVVRSVAELMGVR